MHTNPRQEIFTKLSILRYKSRDDTWLFYETFLLIFHLKENSNNIPDGVSNKTYTYLTCTYSGDVLFAN